MRMLELCRLLTVVVVLLVPGSALAATIFYADCDDVANGGTVVYTDISESGDDAPLYFSPT